MRKDYLKALEAQTAETAQKVNEVNESSFFTENNVNGFFSKDGFVQYFNASSTSERNHLHTVLDAITDGANINNVLTSSFDKNDGHEIMWLNMKLPKSDFPPMRILFDERMLKFFKSYQKSELSFRISLEKLLVVAGLIPTEEQA